MWKKYFVANKKEYLCIMIHQFKAEGTIANLDFDINLEPDKRVYCFIGENGCGKTQLLENMAKTLFLDSSIFHNLNIIPQKNSYERAFYNVSVHTKIVDSYFFVPEKIWIQNSNLKSDSSWTVAQISKIEHYKIGHKFDYPFIFISPKNRGYTKNIDKKNARFLGNMAERFADSVNKTYQSFQRETVEDTSLIDWFSARLLINPEFVQQSETRLHEVEAVLDLMEMLDDKLKTELHQKENRLKNFSFSEGKLYLRGVSIENLSTGYVSILKIFQEIIAGYGGWIGMIGETDIRNTEGVVFIDEIESHLHAKWQYKIIPLLKKFFPKTTFYIATHSPLIVSTTNQDEAYELIREENKVTAKKLGNPKNWYLADVYAQAFHVDFNDKAFEDETQTISLPEMLKNFSNKVRDYTVQPVDILKQEIVELYAQILPNLGEDDPRKRSLDSLYSLVK